MQTEKIPASAVQIGDLIASTEGGSYRQVTDLTPGVTNVYITFQGGAGIRPNFETPLWRTIPVDAQHYFLSRGAHVSAADGRCAMEWVSYLAGEPHSDAPVCVSHVLRAFCVTFNDCLDNGQRQRLRPYLARTIGTAGDGLDDQRAWLARDWLIRVYTPAWLSLAYLDAAADRLRALPPVLAVENLTRAMDTLHGARSEAAAAWAAARDAARPATRGVSWQATRAAAWAAARTASWDAALAATCAAEAAHAGDAAWTAAWDAARAAAWDAAGAAAGTALQPTVLELRRSGFVLLDRMLPTEVIQLPVVEDAEAVCGVPIGV